jgi:hypothetical protein
MQPPIRQAHGPEQSRGGRREERPFDRLTALSEMEGEGRREEFKK